MPDAPLERDDTLEALARAVLDAAAGHGSVALITGEAGIGKTTLVRAFAAAASSRARVLSAACDGPLAAALADGQPFEGLLEELAADAPTVLVVEDLHWADDATLDVLGYAARRIEPLAAVLVVTYRDDEIDPAHPLHRFLAAVSGSPLRRLELRRLSREAVARLAEGTGADPDHLHRVTRGNPFFVSEVLASPG